MNDFEKEELAVVSAPVEAPPVPVGREAVAQAMSVLRDYKSQKSHFDAHIVADEDWWQLRHWDIINAKDGEDSNDRARGELDSKSAWLFSNVVNKHADFMDAIPTFVILPRERNDEAAAKALSQIVPVILDQNKFEKLFNDYCYDKVKHGTAIWGTFWDPDKRGGLGDVLIRLIDPLSLFWEGGMDDIQNSANVFYVTKINRETAKRVYPQLKEHFESAAVSALTEQYRNDDYADDSGKIEVVDWYYKVGDVLHWCKFAAGEVIASTENDPVTYPNGLYKHGMYPFFVDVMYPVKNAVGGFGTIDVGKHAQEEIDRMGRGLIGNVLGSSKGKTFVSDTLGINPEDLADPRKDIIKFVGSIDDSKYKNIQPASNADVYVGAINHKVNEMKETTGNLDAAIGNAPSGITAASALAAMQERAGKTSRDVIKGTYRTFADMVSCVIELIREFYTLPRTFRITGEEGQNEYVTFSNAEMATTRVQRSNGTFADVEPIYDVVVSAQKADAYSSMAQNEFSLQLYNAGFFAPERADQALAAIELMDFRDKQKVIEKISRNGTLLQMVQVLSERLAKAEALLGLSQPVVQPEAGGSASSTKAAKMPEQNEAGTVENEPAITKNARERAANVAVPQ